MRRPPIGTTSEVRQVRLGRAWVMGRSGCWGKRSRAERRGMMSPSWTLCFVRKD